MPGVETLILTIRGGGIAIFQILRLIFTGNRGSEKRVKLVSAAASPRFVADVMLINALDVAMDMARWRHNCVVESTRVT